LLKRFSRAEISCFKAANVFINAGGGYGIKRIKPFGKKRTTALDVFFDLKYLLYLNPFVLFL